MLHTLSFLFKRENMNINVTTFKEIVKNKKNTSNLVETEHSIQINKQQTNHSNKSSKHNPARKVREKSYDFERVHKRRKIKTMK